MRAKSEIMGLCIVNIQTASEIGKIRDVLLDPGGRGIAWYVLEEPSDYFGARLISQKHAVGLGGFALTVSGEEIIEDVAHCPQAIELLKGGVRTVGTYALSDKGVLMGTVCEIFFEELTGGIVRYRVRDEEGRMFEIDGKDVVTLGSNFTIFLDNSEIIEVSPCPGEAETEPASAEAEPVYEDPENGMERDSVGEDCYGMTGAAEEEADDNNRNYGRSNDCDDDHDHDHDRDPERVLKVSARPLSAAELALVRAAESLRQKYAAEALQTQAEENKDRERTSRETAVPVRGREAKSMETTRTAVTESMDTAGERVRALEGGGAETPDSMSGHNRGSLSVAELIYPKDFNHFDRRQMQFLLGKKLTRAVQLETGEVMEEGEYITAEMLSRVRTRNTLMELTARVKGNLQ